MCIRERLRERVGFNFGTDFEQLITLSGAEGSDGGGDDDDFRSRGLNTPGLIDETRRCIARDRAWPKFERFSSVPPQFVSRDRHADV